jgi:hypothetical protein
VLFDQPTDPSNPRRAWIVRDGARMAASAGAKAGALGLVRPAEETDLGAARPAGGAGGPAVDSGGTHGKDESAVAPRVAGKHCPPAFVVGGSRGGEGRECFGGHHATQDRTPGRALPPGSCGRTRAAHGSILAGHGTRSRPFRPETPTRLWSEWLVHLPQRTPMTGHCFPAVVALGQECVVGGTHQPAGGDEGAATRGRSNRRAAALGPSSP